MSLTCYQPVLHGCMSKIALRASRSAWKAAASLAVNGQKNGLQKRHSTVSQQSDENDITQNPNLNEIPLAQVRGS